MNNCKRCGNKISRCARLYCSRVCYWQSMSFGDKPNCVDCNKKVSSHKTLRCKKCFSKNRSGSNHPMWIKDRRMVKKQEERNNPVYKHWRKQVWLRDNFKCKIANPDCKGRLEAHHILGWTPYPELRYEVNNGITLCHFHHPRKRKDEMQLSPYFQSLVLETQ